ncbi:conjugal transfer protein TraX [Anaerolineaceae bacterium oral taxon 439]|nr:conjugal transfer protein TraX [Anaerolineaceae bacterium oral taxon 439]
MNSETILIQETQKKGLSLNALKYIAIAAMVIDHAAVAFLDDSTTLYRVLDGIGRTTAPIMFFAAVEGYHHTRDLKKYLTRLFVFALISYLPFMYGFSDTFRALRLNVIFTIFFGVVAVHAARTIRSLWLKIAVILALMILTVPMDGGSFCVPMMLILDFFYGNRKNQLAGYLIFAVFSFNIADYFLDPFWSLFYLGFFDVEAFIYGEYDSLGYLIPFFLLLFYNGEAGKRGHFPKWFFYIFYPAHLTIIALIRIFLT